MGRASGNANATGDLFAPVLGTRRGLRTDQQELHARARVVAERRAAVDRFMAALDDKAARGVVTLLFERYGTDSAALEQCCYELADAGDAVPIWHAALAAEPEDYPGLLAPALSALGRYFTERAERPDALALDARRAVTAQAQAVIDHFADSAQPHEFYQRIRPVLDGLGVVLASCHVEEGAQQLWEAAVRALWAVEISARPGPPSQSTLNGPFCSWCKAAEQRLRTGRASERDRARLQTVVDSVLGAGALQGALADLADQLAVDEMNARRG